MFTTVWDQTGGCAKHYRFEYAIYLLSCPALEFLIIIDRSVGAPGHGKDVVYVLNVREKMMLKLEITNILNHE